MIEKISDFLITLLPQNPLFFLLYLFLFLVVSVVFIFLIAKRKPKTDKASKKELSLEDLIRIVSNPKSSTKDLISAAMLYVQNFSVESDEKKSFEFFKKLLNHPKRNKAVFDYFHGVILPKNIKFKDKLDELERKALNK